MRRVDSLEKTLMLGEIGDRKKGTTEDEMAGRHHQLKAHEFKQAPGDGGQRILHAGLHSMLQSTGSQRVRHD